MTAAENRALIFLVFYYFKLAVIEKVEVHHHIEEPIQGGSSPKTLQTKTIAIENSTYMLTKVMVKVGLNYNFDRYDLIAVVIQHLGPLH